MCGESGEAGGGEVTVFPEVIGQESWDILLVIPAGGGVSSGNLIEIYR